MRTSVTSKILSLAVMLAWMGWAASPTQAVSPEGCQASCNPGCGGVEQAECADPVPCRDPFSFLKRFCDRDGCGPQWSFTAEAVALQRSTTRNQNVFETINRTSLMNSQTMDFPLAYGAQIGAIRHGVCGWDLEFAYMQLDGFESLESAVGPAWMVTDSTGAFALVNSPSARYGSALYSGELNARRQWNEWLTLLAGFRMVELDEEFLSGGTGFTGAEIIRLNANTFNHLYGFQIGADAEVYNMGGPLLINAICKAGAYQNYASQNMSRVDTGVSSLSLGATKERVAFMGEFGVVATYALTKHLAFRASAEAAWLEGVALAPEQIGANNFGTLASGIDTAGGVFYYGGGVGLEYRF
jgi:hypothetical protein